MRTLRSALAIGITIVSTHLATAIPVELFEYGFNLNGNLAPGGVNLAGLNLATGLGTVNVSVTSGGANWFSVFFDHELGVAFTDDNATAVGTPGSGASWEIDEPGYAAGDIYDNFSSSSGSLDNTVGTSVYGSTAFPDDVSMALGWQFTGPATITIHVSDLMPSTGFYLKQWDTPDADNAIYLWGDIALQSPGTGVPEGGATVLMLGLGLASLYGLRRKTRD